MKLFRQERGQASFEYVLVLATAVVVGVLMLTGFPLIMPQVAELLCPTVDPVVTGTCVVP